MKLPSHHNLYRGIAELLPQIFLEGAFTDQVLEKQFKKNRQWGSRDRGFVAEQIYDMVRWKRLINHASQHAIEQQRWWDFMGSWFIINNYELPDFREFEKLNGQKIKKSYLNAFKHSAIKHSVSDELYQLGVQELSDQWETELEALNELAPVVIRVNTLKITPQELIKQLEAVEITAQPIEGYADALEIQERTSLFTTEAFKNGYFEMQDASSQLVAPFLEVAPGMRVADTCAGAGGKSLHLASLMQNKGQLLSMDIYEWKLKELKRRAKRNGAHNITTKFIDSTKAIKRLKGTFDRVLIDAPCTGVGVLKRNPDAKYKIDDIFLDRVTSEQKQILENYSKLLKPGGLMVYATCSIFPSENELQVKQFLQNHSEFKLVEQKCILPSKSGFDGFYMAKMYRIS